MKSMQKWSKGTRTAFMGSCEEGWCSSNTNLLGSLSMSRTARSSSGMMPSGSVSYDRWWRQNDSLFMCVCFVSVELSIIDVCTVKRWCHCMRSTNACVSYVSVYDSNGAYENSVKRWQHQPYFYVRVYMTSALKVCGLPSPVWNNTDSCHWAQTNASSSSSRARPVARKKYAE